MVIAFVAFSLPPYLTFDPSRSRVPVGDAVRGYYPLLVAHVIFGSIALLTACLQIWPWLRTRFPDVHRRTGRVYVFAGVLPAGAIGLVIGALTPFGPVLRASNVRARHRLADRDDHRLPRRPAGTGSPITAAG